jgi:hypothetical protein
VRFRLALGAVAVVVVAAAAFWSFGRTKTVAPRVQVPELAATIGSGSEAIGVTSDGALVRWLPLPEEPPLPTLPLTQPPKHGHLAGPALAQAKVLGAVPDALRPYVASSYYGESGVDVNLTDGIELRFGDASQAARKWQAAATVLADPSITTLGYVDLHAPGHPAYGGSGHELPSAP